MKLLSYIKIKKKYQSCVDFKFNAFYELTIALFMLIGPKKLRISCFDGIAQQKHRKVLKHTPYT